MVTLDGSPEELDQWFVNSSSGRNLTPKCFNVLLHPLESQTLIAKSKIGIAALLNLFAHEKTPCTEPVVESNTNERLANIYSILNHK